MEKNKKESKEMDKLTCYETILYKLLLFNYATKKSLLLIGFSKDTIYRAIERGLEEKTISKARVNYHKAGVTRKHKTTYLTIIKMEFPISPKTVQTKFNGSKISRKKK